MVSFFGGTFCLVRQKCPPSSMLFFEPSWADGPPRLRVMNVRIDMLVFKGPRERLAEALDPGWLPK